MKGKERHIFPGNNTPIGFLSYYQYILDQQEADRILCLKGGPGVGKSTFMKLTGVEMLEKGYDVDFLHCSSDVNSLDGIIIKDLKIALIDGTAPHVVDPKNPGAVDMIINLGDFWNEEDIRVNKEDILKCNRWVQFNFEKAYNYFGAARKIYDNMNSIYENALDEVEIYKEAARLVNIEFSHKELSKKTGKVKKFFASALTPQGNVNYIDSLIDGFEKIYVIKGPVGINGNKIMSIIKESSKYRGFDIECFYCSMVPDNKIEHIVIPELELAFVSSNYYHKLKVDAQEIINLNDYIHWNGMCKYKEMIKDSERLMEELLDKGVECIQRAKIIHDDLETNYIPNMNFEAVENYRKEIVNKYLLKSELN